MIVVAVQGEPADQGIGMAKNILTVCVVRDAHIGSKVDYVFDRLAPGDNRQYGSE